MKRISMLVVAALAALSLAACNKNGGGATASSDTSNATTADNTTGNATADNGTGGNTGGIGQAKAVNDVQDAAAAPVGLASAATLGSHDTGAFVTNAAMSDMYEIQAAKMAEQKSSSPAVKSFARQMIKDHSMTTAQLKGMISKGEVKADLPTALDQRRQGLLDNLSASSGKEFDTRYAQQQDAAHQEAVTMFTGYAKNGDNAKLKAWAGSTAPKLQHHLDMAKQLVKDTTGQGGGANGK